MIARPEESCRLGKRQLGRHAFEKHMPPRVHAIASDIGGSNMIDGVIQVLAHLLSQDIKTKSAYLCSSTVKHVFKAKGEGDHFCGYRNIQMLLSSISESKSDRSSASAGVKQCSILQLQTLIEEAWDAGFNSNGRIETGGIHDTRKHIGTSEAQALFDHLGMAGPAKAFSNINGSKTAYIDLLDYVERYFTSEGCGQIETGRKICRTQLAPIYLQRPRHSVTIVGFQQRTDGSRSLLVFDPGYKPPRDLVRCLSTKCEIKHPKSVLRAYQKKVRYLKRYRAFETLQIHSP